MDNHTLQDELTRIFDELQALSELSEQDRNIAQCLDNCVTYLEGAIDIAREKNHRSWEFEEETSAGSHRNSQRGSLSNEVTERSRSAEVFGIYRWIATNTAPEEAIDLILALEDSSTPIQGE